MAEPAHDAATFDTSGGRRSSATLRVYTLGTFRVERDGVKIDDERWTRRKARQLFKCLITRSTKRLLKDEAFELFWPDSDPEAAAKTLRTTVHSLRQALAGGRRADGVDWIVVDADGVGIRPDVDVWVDADVFERLLHRARGADHADDLLEEADRLYLGEYLPNDLYEDWAARRREVLKREWGDLELALARAREQRQEIDGAATALVRLIQADPCDERAVRELMGLLARNGRRAEALRAYQQLVVALRDELGFEPAAETRLLHQQIADGRLDGRTEVGPGPTPSTPARQHATAGPPTARPATEALAPPAANRRFTSTYPFPVPTLLIGRERELLWLERMTDPSRSTCRTVFVAAAAGTGKSTLAGALVRRASERGVLCLAGGSFDHEHSLPFGPVRDALADYLLDGSARQVRESLGEVAADLAEIVPELRYHLGLPPATTARILDAGRLFAAVHGCLRVLAQGRPVLLCLEDLHAADDATLGLLHYLARQTRRVPITMLGTYRTDEVAPGHPLDRLVVALGRERLAETIRLEPFGLDEAASLVMALLDGPASDELNASLYNVTEGNPLFLEQLTLALLAERRVDQRDGIWHRVDDDRATVPPIIRDVIGRRFSRLSDRCQGTLALAATFGQTFEHRALVVALGGDEARANEDLDEAISAQLVYETASGYRFGHAMVRESLYGSLSRPRRQLLHATAAAALETLSGAAVEERAAELAYHFLLAGDEPTHRERSFRYSIVAGRHAAALSAHREALKSFSQACTLGERLTTPERAEAYVDALQGRAFAERQLGLWQSCTVTSRLILEISSSPLRRALIRATLVRALQALGDTVEANGECDSGLAELADPDTDDADMARARTRLLYEKSYLSYLFGRFHETERLGRQMLAITERQGRPMTSFLPHSSLGLAFMHQGRDREAVHFLREGIAAAQHEDDRLNEAVFHENLGKQHYQAVRFEDALKELQRAVELYRGTAGELRAVNALRLIGRVALATGDLRRAADLAGRALGIALESRDRWASECSDVLGDVAILRADWRDAAEHFRRALQIREPIGHADGIVESLVGLATVAELQGAWDQAETLARRANDVARAMDLCPDQVRPLRVLARLSLRRGDLDAGMGYLNAAQQCVELTRPTIEEAPTHLISAELAARRGGIPAALDHLSTVLEVGGTVDVLVEAHVVLARLLVWRGEHEAARSHATLARDLAARTGAPRHVGLALLATGVLAAPLGDLSAAGRDLEAARRTFEAAALPFDVAVALREHGRLLADAGQTIQGQTLLAAARSGFEKLGAQLDAVATEAGHGVRSPG